MAEAAGRTWSWALWVAGALVALFFGVLAVDLTMGTMKYGSPRPRTPRTEGGWMAGHEETEPARPLRPGQQRSLLGTVFSTAPAAPTTSSTAPRP